MADPTTPAARAPGTRSEAAAAPGEARALRPLTLAAALALWAATTFTHGWGTTLARAFFDWGRAPGHLAESGGRDGFRAAERVLAGAFLLVVAGAVGAALRGLLRQPPAERRARLLAGGLWAAFVLLLWRTCIVYTTELVHFAQYGAIGALLTVALARGRRPERAFVAATLLGVLDEAWQHWGIALWIEGNLRHGLDWSDLILNATGACGGALLAATCATGDDAAPLRVRGVLRAACAVAVVCLPLRLLDPVTLARLFGTYTYHPFWSELENDKPVHWMTPSDGIPAFVAAFLFLGLVAAAGRTLVPRVAALALALLAVLAIDAPSRRAGRAVHEVVPTLTAARVAAGGIVADGRLDEPAWQRAARVGPFVAHVGGGAATELPDGTLQPLAATYARVLWDEHALHVAFEVADDDVWARDVARDEPTLPGDEVVEVFIDPDGDEITYYEFELSPAGAVYDLFNWIPAPPSDYSPGAAFLGLADWDARGVATGVTVDGTLDVVHDWEPLARPDRDTGWTAEISIPWSVFRTTTTPSSASIVALPPRPGDRWRLGLHRVERPRRAPDGTPLARADAGGHAQLQAWSPPHRNSFHCPERFGVLEFGD